MQWHHRGSVTGSIFVIIALIVACLVPSGCILRAETTHYDQQFRGMVLSLPIYSMTVSSVSLLDKVPGHQVLTQSQEEAFAQQVLSLIHISEPTRRTPISYAVFCLKNN